MAAERLVLAAALLVSGCGAAPRASSPPVVLVTIDTLRADHLPAYGYRAVETPALEALRRDAILFENAYSHCPLTLPSHASLFTGLLPPRHGVRSNVGYRLAATHRTIAAALRERGYATGGFVSSYVLRAATGIAVGFDRYDEVAGAPLRAIGDVQRPGPETVARATAWLDGVATRPFLLFVHLYEPHSPYAPPEPFRARYGATYDGEIAAADAALGSLIGALKARGLYDAALVVVTADHGEGLSQHGEEEHGVLLYREALHVPLFVKLPGRERAGERVTTPVGLDQVSATLGAGPGASLLGPLPAGPIYAETFYPRLHLGWSELRSLVDARRHYIDGPRPELYDVVADPGETADLAARAEAEPYRARLASIDAGLRAPEVATAEEREGLAALGYVGATVAVDGNAVLPNPRERLRVRERMKPAVALARAGRDAEAAGALGRIVADEPGFFDARVELGAALARLERPADALAQYQAAAALSPVLAPSLALPMARLALETRDFEEAERLAAVARDAPDAGPEVRVLAAEILLARGRPAEALALVARDATPSPVPGLEFVRGDALARLDRTAEARRALAAEVAADPGHLRAWASLALVSALETGRPAEAGAVLESMYRANPRPAAAALAVRTLRFMGETAAAAAWKGRLH